MAQILPLELDTVPLGESSGFRNTINSNFSKIVAYMNDNEFGTKIVVSKDMPDASEMSPGSFWYKILD